MDLALVLDFDFFEDCVFVGVRDRADALERDLAGMKQVNERLDLT